MHFITKSPGRVENKIRAITYENLIEKYPNIRDAVGIRAKLKLNREIKALIKTYAKQMPEWS